MPCQSIGAPARSARKGARPLRIRARGQRNQKRATVVLWFTTLSLCQIQLIADVALNETEEERTLEKSKLFEPKSPISVNLSITTGPDYSPRAEISKN